MLKNICCIELRSGSKEEIMPDFQPDFPYLASYVDFDWCAGHFVPWHWHKEAELFYVEEGVLEYHLSRGTVVLPAGCGGLVNSNVLHMTRPRHDNVRTTQFNHIFDVSLVGGWQGSRIEQKYITPLVTAPQVEMVALRPEVPEQAQILEAVRASFQITEGYAYEVRLRAALSNIWCQVFALAEPLLREKARRDKTSDHLKTMMAYMHEHYTERLSVAEIAAAAFISERECYRAFRDTLHTTPVEYLKGYRLQQACQLLAQGAESLTSISQLCGLGSSSYFGKVFRAQFGCTPLEYRRRWQESDGFRRK